jgi:hypothetical protein
VVHITVGTEPARQSFAIHKELLCRKVPYFDAMFNGGYAETVSQVGDLPEESLEAFELFVTWVYLDVIDLPGDPEQASPIPAFIQLFALADKYGITKLADTLMDFFTKFLRDGGWMPTPSDMELAYQCTHSTSRMRLFISRVFAYAILCYDDDDGITWNTPNMTQAARVHEDLWVDAFKLMRGQAGQEVKDPTKMAACDYHQHDVEEPCPYLKPTHFVFEGSDVEMEDGGPSKRLAKAKKTSKNATLRSLSSRRNTLREKRN